MMFKMKRKWLNFHGHLLNLDYVRRIHIGPDTEKDLRIEFHPEGFVVYSYETKEIRDSVLEKIHEYAVS